MEIKATKHLVSSLFFIGGMFGILCCLCWIFISNNKLVDWFSKRADPKTEAGKTHLHLKELKIPELAGKYLKSCQ